MQCAENEQRDWWFLNMTSRWLLTPTVSFPPPPPPIFRLSLLLAPTQTFELSGPADFVRH